MSYLKDSVIDELNKLKEHSVTCHFCGHVTDLEESEGEVWHWADCPLMNSDDDYDPSEQYARDQYANK